MKRNNLCDDTTNNSLLVVSPGGTDKKKYMFIDAESDGLYGKILSVAAIVCDEDVNMYDMFNGYVKCKKKDLSDDFAREHVYDHLSSGDYCYRNEEALLEAFWSFYCKYDKCDIIVDTPYPVETRLFEKCIHKDIKNREFKGPYPMMDLSSMLYAVGMEPNDNRRTLIDCSKLTLHNAFDDVRMSIDIWKKWIVDNTEGVYRNGNPKL